MQHATAMRAEREEATTASELVMGAINLQTGIMAVQESTNAAVADKEHVARRVARQHVFNLADNAQLRVNRSFPATNADVGLPEELIGHRLELVGDEETCSGSVVLVHRLAHLYVEAQLCGNDLGGLDRLSLCAGDDLRGT